MLSECVPASVERAVTATLRLHQSNDTICAAQPDARSQMLVNRNKTQQNSNIYEKYSQRSHAPLTALHGTLQCSHAQSATDTSPQPGVLPVFLGSSILHKEYIEARAPPDLAHDLSSY